MDGGPSRAGPALALGRGVITRVHESQLPRPRILLVDPDPGLRFAIGDYLRRVGAAVDEAGSAGEAHAWLARAAYDSVITDLRLSSGSDVDGLILARRIRAAAPATTVCILTVPVPPALMQEAEAAAHVVLTRPRRLPDLAQVVFAMLPDPAGQSFTSTGMDS